LHALQFYAKLIDAVSVKLEPRLQSSDLKFPKTRGNYKSVGGGSDIDECTIPLPPASAPATNGAAGGGGGGGSGTNGTGPGAGAGAGLVTDVDDAPPGRSARVDSLTPPLPPPMGGWLTKEGHSIMAGWKKRYFMLKEGAFGYYGNETLAKQYGNIALSNAGIQLVGEKRLVIMTAAGTPYKLEGAEVGVLREWMEALERHIAYATTMTLLANTTGGGAGGGGRASFTEKSEKKSFFERMSRTGSKDLRDSFTEG
jgi:hypothetical protein